MLETSMRVEPTISKETSITQSYQCRIEPPQVFNHPHFNDDIYRPSFNLYKGGMAPLTKDQQVSHAVSPNKDNVSGSDAESPPSRLLLHKKVREKNGVMRKPHHHQHRRYEFDEFGRKPLGPNLNSAYNYNNNSNIANMGYNNINQHAATSHRRTKDARLIPSNYHTGSRGDDKAIPIHPKPVRLSPEVNTSPTYHYSNDSIMNHKQNHQQMLARSNFGEKRKIGSPGHTSNTEDIKKLPCRLTGDLQKPKKRFKGFGISDIIGDIHDNNEKTKEQVEHIPSVSKRKISHKDSHFEVPKKKTKLPNEELHNIRAMSPIRKEHSPPDIDRFKGLTHDNPTLPPNILPPYANPYLVNGVVNPEVNPALLAMGPQFLNDPTAMFRSALPPFANGLSANNLAMNPFLLPQLFKGSFPGYDVNYLLEQQKQMVALINQAKTNPFYQMNPLFRALASNTSEPMLMATLLSAQKQRMEMQQSLHSDLQQIYPSAQQAQMQQNMAIQENIIRQMQNQKEMEENFQMNCVNEDSLNSEKRHIHERSRFRASSPDRSDSSDHSEIYLNKNNRTRCQEIKVPSNKSSSSSLNNTPHCSKMPPVKIASSNIPKKLHKRNFSQNDNKSSTNQHAAKVGISLKNDSLVKQQPRSLKNHNNANVTALNEKVGDKLPVDDESTSSKSAGYKNLSRERRLVANARERTRVHTISSAFEELRNQIPSYSCNQKLSKLAILRIACTYIKSLSVLSGYDMCSESTFDESVESCTKVLQSESRARSRRKSNKGHSEWEAESSNAKHQEKQWSHAPVFSDKLPANSKAMSEKDIESREHEESFMSKVLDVIDKTADEDINVED